MDAPQRVVWMLDVDGVISPFSRTDPRQVVEHGFEHHGSLVFAPYVIDRIAHLLSTGKVEGRWLTAWEDDANRLLAERLGFPRLATYPAGPSRGWWKAAVIDEVLDNEPVRVIFADDEMNYWTDRDGGVAMVGLADRWNDRILTLCPDPNIGLTEDDLDVIETYLRSP